MNDIVSKLLLYGDMKEDTILMELCKIVKELKSDNYERTRKI